MVYRPDKPRFRGYAAVALDRPRFEVNVGGALRAASIYGAAMVVTSGQERSPDAPTNQQKAHRHMPYFTGMDSVYEALPWDCIPVAVELLDDAVPLHDYEHPERAMYVFGGESATLDGEVLERCEESVVIPAGCHNLAAAVNVVLYDRLAKLLRREQRKAADAAAE